MAKAKFTKDQLKEAVTEFLDESAMPEVLSGAGNNGSITVYKKEETENGQDEG